MESSTTNNRERQRRSLEPLPLFRRETPTSRLPYPSKLSVPKIDDLWFHILVNDSSVLPEVVKSKAISSIIIIRHPIFEEFGGLVEDVIIHHLEDGFTIDED